MRFDLKPRIGWVTREQWALHLANAGTAAVEGYVGQRWRRRGPGRRRRHLQKVPRGEVGLALDCCRHHHGRLLLQSGHFRSQSTFLGPAHGRPAARSPHRGQDGEALYAQASELRKAGSPHGYRQLYSAPCTRGCTGTQSRPTRVCSVRAWSECPVHSRLH
jgi:hypothetical protein